MNDLVWFRSFRDKLSRVELWCAELASEVHRGFRRKLSESTHACNSSGVDSEPPFASVRFAAVESAPHLRRRLARFLELLPVGSVLKRLVVFGERVSGLALLQEHIAPRFQG